MFYEYQSIHLYTFHRGRNSLPTWVRCWPSSPWRVQSHSFLPDVCLCAAVSCQLVLSEIGVVGGRDEVVCQWVFHVLVNPSVFRVENTVLLRQHVHGESVGGHELVLLGCTGQKAQTQVNKRGDLCGKETGVGSHSAFCEIEQILSTFGYIICFFWDIQYKTDTMIPCDKATGSLTLKCCNEYIKSRTYSKHYKQSGQDFFLWATLT